MRRAGAVGVSVLAVLLIAAAAGAARPAAVVVRVTLTTTGMRVSAAHVLTGRRVVFLVHNASRIRQVFTVHGHPSHAVPAGETRSFALLFKKPGEYSLSSRRADEAAPTTHGFRAVAAAAPPSLTGLVKLVPFAHADSPTDIVSPPDDPDRVFVTQQNGLVLLFIDGQLQDEPFLDLTGVVRDLGESGLFSIAFSPDYASSGLLYVYYADQGGFAHLVEYQRSPLDPNVAGNARDVLNLPQSSYEHFAGDMQFGPDGDLYLSIGDGGHRPDEAVGYYGQTLDDLLGSIIPIDPRHGDPYTVPRGNPFFRDPGVDPEIVASGLRNPWRIWIDNATDTLFIADVGEDVQEEIDRMSLHDLGLNFGWPCREGTVVPPEPTVVQPASCATAALTPPLYSYEHSDTRCAVIGGVVADDPQLPALEGLYLWSDLCDDDVYALDPTLDAPRPMSLGIKVAAPTTFGEDGAGRLYLGDYDGDIWRLVPAA
jgi:glucose/arabinose dehydrogenase